MSIIAIAVKTDVETRIFGTIGTTVFRITSVRETLDVNLTMGQFVYVVRFSGPAQTSAGKDHARNRGCLTYTDHSDLFCQYYPDLSAMPSHWSTLIHGPSALRALVIDKHTTI